AWTAWSGRSASTRLSPWSAPRLPPVLSMETEKLVTQAEAVQQAVLEHRRVELDGVLLVAPQVFRGKTVPSLLDFHRLGAAAHAGKYDGLAIHDRSGGVVRHPFCCEGGLPRELAIRDDDSHDLAVRFRDDQLRTVNSHEHRRSV